MKTSYKIILTLQIVFLIAGIMLLINSFLPQKPDVEFFVIGDSLSQNQLDNSLSMFKSIASSLELNFVIVSEKEHKLINS